jgi:hypothetical protein
MLRRSVVIFHSVFNSCVFFPSSIFYNSNTGFLCLVIYRRDTHVVELQIGNLTSRLEDACAPDQYDVSRTPFTTLLGRMTEHFSCNLTPHPSSTHNAAEAKKKSAALFAGVFSEKKTVE